MRDPLREIHDLAETVRDKLQQVQEEVGRLDDLYETDYIDNRLDGGAYQQLTNAIAMVELYMDDVKNNAAWVEKWGVGP